MRALMLSAAVLLLAAAAPPPAARAADTALAPRAAFFGNPTRTQARLSPDGRWISWLAPREGVLNVFVAPAGHPEQARPVTNDRARPIRQHFWSPDSSMILFVNDKGGDENFLLYGVDVRTGVQRTLTPFDKTRVEVLGVSPDVKDRILVGVNNRDPRWHDVYSLDLASGKLTEVFANDGYGGFVVDDQLNIRIAQKPRPDGGADYYRVEGGKVADKPFTSVSFEDSDTTRPVVFTRDGRTLYWFDSRGRDTAVLTATDWPDGRTRVVASDPRVDLEGAMTDPRTGRIDAYAVNYLKTDWVAAEPSVSADLAFLKSHLKGEFEVVSRTDADDKWIVADDPVDGPPASYLYDRGTRTLTLLFVSRPELQGAPLQPMHPLELKARDGKTLVSYLTLPAGSDPDGDGKPDRPLPMVLYVHGGPWGRDEYGFEAIHQWLANRGYAVLSVNFRGSTGFGKGFIAAGDREWAGKMHDDLIDAVAWAVKSGVADPAKVAIMGGSYGGYATLVGVTFTPTTFACGVDIVGPSNLNTLLSSIPPYWEAGKEQMFRRVGDPRTPDGQALLRERSPLTHADAIVRPLLIGQGANDPRVHRAEADQIVAAMRAKSIPVTYVLFPDEGHGFGRPENATAFWAVSETFLSRCLGGRAEGFGDALKASSITVPYGAQFSPGLAEAMAAKAP